MKIAIVGIGGLFPGSLDAAQFWNHILRGTDLITDVPATHWKASDYLDGDPKAPDKTYCARGGFLPQVPFDCVKEGIPPSLLSSTDTSQLLGLLVARTTLEEAMGPLHNADKSRVSCILGVTSGQELFGQMASRLRAPEWRAGMKAAGIDDDAVEVAVKKIGDAMVPWTEATFPGLLGNVVAGRIANKLDLGGTNAVTDAACASSFAALSMGVDELLLKRADVVLSGGVDTLNDIFMYMCFSKTPALSSSGECRPFDAKADGTLLGEGLGMVALKRLEDAERDGNKIYAVIRGIGTSSDGKSKSVYAPVSEGQAKAIARAYDEAGYDARTVELVEAHGTGTRAGDVAELGGLALAFDAAAPKSVAIGSVKAQIGHTKSAAGAAGLIKAALALHEKVIPPTTKIDQPLPALADEKSPFYVAKDARPWVRASDHPRRAGVSSFGFGGSNFHIALEEYAGASADASAGTSAGSARAAKLSARDVDVAVLSAPTPAALADRAREALSKGRGVGANLGWTSVQDSLSRASRTKEACRAAFVTSSPAETERFLDVIARGENAPGLFRSSMSAGAERGKVAFLFPGQGSQSLGMGAAVAMEFAEARAVLDEAADIDASIAKLVFAPSAFSDDERARQSRALTKTENAQPALGVVSASFLAALRSVGVDCDMAAGHSFGELTALYAAGAFDFTSLVRLAKKRGVLMARSAESASSTPGAMAAVIADRKAVESVLPAGVVVANENAPDQTVISGPAALVDDAIALLSKRGVIAKKLAVSTAFHSPLVEAACAPLSAFLDDVEVRAASFPVYANTTAAMHGDSASIKRELSRQVRERVRFVDEVRAMYDAGARVFVEVGPGSVLTGLASRIVPNATCIATDGRDGGLKPFFTALAKLYAAGVDVDLARLPRAASSKAPVVTKTSVMISGSNVGKPALPAPHALAPRITAPATTTTTTKKTSASAPAPTRAPAPPKANPMTTKPPAPPALNSSWLDVLREGQRQTADAHIAFQKALTDAHAAYLASFESTQNALVAALSGQPVQTRVVESKVVARELVEHQVNGNGRANGNGNGHAANGNGYANGNGHANGHANGNGHGKPVVIPSAAALAPVVTKPAVTTSNGAKAASAPATNGTGHTNGNAHASSNGSAIGGASAGGSINARGLLLDVVADKTGYPKDSLEDAMSLEADLGIDSIKRVEILGALKEKLPAAGALDALQLAQLKTLGEIAAALSGAVPSTSAPVTVVAKMSAPAPVLSSSSDGALLGQLLDIVAEKTGYPKDALSPGMALESDLGVDSIKRVEILSALKERVPQLPAVEPVKLAQLLTIGEIATALGASGPF